MLDDSTTQVDLTLNTESSLRTDFNIFPNPSKGELRINTNSDYHVAKLYGVNGQFIMDLSVNTSLSIDLEPGIYFVKIAEHALKVIME